MNTFILISAASMLMTVLAGLAHAISHGTDSAKKGGVYKHSSKDESSISKKSDTDTQFKLSTYSSGNISTTSLGDYL